MDRLAYIVIKSYKFSVIFGFQSFSNY